MKAVVLLVLTSVLLKSSSESFDYCEVNCFAGPGVPPNIHTMCTYKDEKPGKLCVNLDASKMLKKEDKDDILYLHNELRNKVALGKEPPQPTASNMMEMVWDKELETIARRWALQCIYEHDKCRSTKDKVHCGQNLAVTAVSKGSINTFTNAYKTQIKGWYNEFKILPLDLIDKYRQRTPEERKEGMTGHYTQLVWAASSKLGCERVYFDFTITDFPPKHWGMTEYLVCVYFHGNMIGESVYKRGKPCSACPKQEKCDKHFLGLCANPLAQASKQPSGDSGHGNISITSKPLTGKNERPSKFSTSDTLTINDQPSKKPQWLGGGLAKHTKYRKSTWGLRTATATANKLFLNPFTASVLLALYKFIN